MSVHKNGGKEIFGAEKRLQQVIEMILSEFSSDSSSEEDTFIDRLSEGNSEEYSRGVSRLLNRYDSAAQLCLEKDSNATFEPNESNGQIKDNHTESKEPRFIKYTGILEKVMIDSKIVKHRGLSLEEIKRLNQT